jgi:predicted dehydrogenase
MYRFHPQIRKLKELIANGSIGDIRSLRANFSFILYDLTGDARPKRATGAADGGALSDVGCYAVDFLNSIIGNASPVHIQSMSRKLVDDPGFDVSTAALIQYPNGVTATLECSVDTPSLNNWEVSGTKGSVSALRFDPQGTSEVPLYVVNEDSEAKLISCPSIDAFAEEFKNFSQAILKNAATHISPNESIQNAAVLEQIRKACNAAQVTLGLPQ